MALVTGAQVFYFVYPPRLVSAEVYHALRMGKPGYASVFIAALLMAELVLAKRLWCRRLCPGGAIYSALGTARLLRIHRDAALCIACRCCDRACPHDLEPSHSALKGECDNCGLCKDEAHLAVILFALTAFHGLTMTPLWDNFDPATFSMVGAMVNHLGVNKLSAFTIGMIVVLAAPAALYSAICLATKWVSNRKEPAAKEIFIQFSYSLLPLAPRCECMAKVVRRPTPRSPCFAA